ncbi:MAG: hypothetical protein RL240_3804 [Planctomycetota bacterium]|jgi:hypothetical protein
MSKLAMRYLFVFCFLAPSFSIAFGQEHYAISHTGKETHVDKDLRAAFLDRGISTRDRSYLARLLFGTASINQLDELGNADGSLATRLTALWRKIEIVAQAELIIHDTDSVKLSGKLVDQFLAEIESNGLPVPQHWNKLLKSAVLRRDGLLDVYAADLSPIVSDQLTILKLVDEEFTVSDGKQKWMLNLPTSLKNCSAIGGVTASETAYVLVEDLATAWSYHLLKLTSNGVDWQRELETYWAMPEGSRVSLEIVTTEEKVFVFVALPTSIGVNVIDANTGSLISSFNSQIADVSQLKWSVER